MFTEAEPGFVLQAYREGIFPMAEEAGSPFFDFYRPKMRGQLSIEKLHIPKRLKKTVRQAPYKVTIDRAFVQIIDGCAAEGKNRKETWINPAIRDVFIKLHKEGFAHSVECWEGDALAGGLYGLALGCVFCGESMVSFRRDASKVALVHLAARLWKGGFKILDTQFTNPHLEQFGIYEIPQEKYETLIKKEMKKRADFRLEGIDKKELVEAYLQFQGQNL